MMQQMGYRPGAGLGKHEDGPLHAAAAALFRGRHGLGHAAYAPPPPPVVGRPPPRRYTSRPAEPSLMDTCAPEEPTPMWDAPMSHLVAHMYPDGVPDAARPQMEIAPASPRKSPGAAFALVA